MTELIIENYVQFLKRIRKNQTSDFGKESLQSYSRLSVFGSYSNAHKLILNKKEDKNKYKKYILVTETVKNINYYYKNYSSIVLRPYFNEITLIIGCGNVIKSRGDIGNEKYDMWYNFSKTHSHIDIYTIGPDLRMNPSVCDEFGDNEHISIPDGAFQLIYFEGFLWDDVDDMGKYVLSELNRILSNGGKICIKNSRLERDILYKKDNNLLSFDDNKIVRNFKIFLKYMKNKYSVV